MTVRPSFLCALIACEALACTSSPPSGTRPAAPSPSPTAIAAPAGLLWTYETGG
jgi:hypothetical protein